MTTCNNALLTTTLLVMAACAPAGPGEDGRNQLAVAGQAAISDNVSQKTIARIAAESPDHGTLVTALKAVNYADPLANPGPFTVFAPTDAAFDQLPAGTVKSLLKADNAAQLRTILLHHVTTSAFGPEDLTNGMELGMVDGGPVSISKAGGDLMIGEAKLLASVRGSNGWVHVVDKVLLPAAK
jgi:uncharacterized surface protein with fasciclin (FAS1) repeats